MNNKKLIAFDAGETFWVNDPYFQEAKRKFCLLLEEYMSQHRIT
jgi:putative hydrolase of the HAD superfamily